MSLDFLCRWQIKVFVNCARRIPAHIRCTQYSPYPYMLLTVYLFMADIGKSGTHWGAVGHNSMSLSCKFGL